MTTPQRQRTAILSVAGLLLAAALVGVVVLIVNDDEDAGSEALSPVTPSATTTVSPSATAEATATPSPAALRPDRAALVAPEELPTSDQWIRRASSRTFAEQPSVVDPCSVEQELSGAGSVGYVHGSYIIEDPETPGEPVIESGGFFQAVVQYETEAQAEAAYGPIADSVSRCPTREGNGARFESTPLSQDPLVVSELQVEPPYAFPVYYGVARSGVLVSVFEYNPGETRADDVAEQIGGLVRAALERGQ